MHTGGLKRTGEAKIFRYVTSHLMAVISVVVFLFFITIFIFRNREALTVRLLGIMSY